MKWLRDFIRHAGQLQGRFAARAAEQIGRNAPATLKIANKYRGLLYKHSRRSIMPTRTP
jgi:hypothetical protein